MDAQLISDAVSRALAEDVGQGDLTTTATVPADARARARITQKQPGVIFGLELVEETFRQLDSDLVFRRLASEGVWRSPGPVMEIEGPARPLLTGERTALNFVQRLSGVATMSARAAQAVAGTGATVLDTRKTTPGLRALEKAAVAAGGATNHRAGLYDAILIKENHAALAGGVGEGVRLARAAVEQRPREGQPEVPIEAECRTLEEVDEALGAGAGWILLDNMTPGELRAAVDHVAGRAKLEASGGVTLENLPEIAATGVQFISLGALTHSAPALDFSLTLEPLS